MLERGYNHQSPLDVNKLINRLTYNPGIKREYYLIKVDRKVSLLDLMKRCPKCHARMLAWKLIIKRFVLDGQLTKAQKNIIEKTLNEREYFIPEQVGLQHAGASLPGYPNEDGYPWHTLVIRETLDPWSGEFPVTPKDFVERFQGIVWDPEKCS